MRVGVQLQQGDSSSLPATSPPPALTSNSWAVSITSPQHVPITCPSDQCRRRKGWKQRKIIETIKMQAPWSAHDHLAQDRHTGFLRSLKAWKSQRTCDLSVR